MWTVPSAALPRGPGPPGSGPHSHRARQTRGSTPEDRDESPPLRPSPGLGGPAGRVFAADLSECPACGGRLRILTALTDPVSVRTYLEDEGLPPVPRRGPHLSPGSSSPPDLPSRPVPVAGRTAGCAPQRSLRPRIDPDTGRQANQTVLHARSNELQNDQQQACPAPCGAFGTLAKEIKRGLILPILWSASINFSRPAASGERVRHRQHPSAERPS